MIKKVAVTGKAPKGGVVMFETETGCPTSLKTCEYSVTPGSLFPITNVVVTLADGTDKTITSVSAATDQASLATILKTEMEALGYQFTEAFGNVSDLPSVKVSGQTLTIYSELVFKSINSAGVVNFTAKCTRKGKCTFTRSTGTVANPVINVNGTNRSIAQTWTYGSTSAATVKGHIETALAAEISAGTVLTVTVTETGTAYKIDIVALTGTIILFNTASFTQSGCTHHFTT